MLALAFGSFTIGTTEFVTMGLLPQIANGVDATIPSAGHLVSAYAIGVVVGGPSIAFFTPRLPQRGMLLALMGACAIANACSALAADFELLIAARFAAGLPHGAFFGLASVVAANLADPARRGRAVAQVMLGLSVANVVGVPVATWIGQHLGWRSAFAAVAALGLLAVVAMGITVPKIPARAGASGREELRAFGRPQVLLTVLAAAVGSGGMFAVYTYIAPTVIEGGGLEPAVVPIFLLVFGLGMTSGTWVAGELADWSIFRSLFVGGVGLALVLLCFAVAVPFGWWALPLVFAVPLAGMVFDVNLQLRLIDVAGNAQAFGAATNHAALNVANALGAWMGGLGIAAGMGYRSPAVLGAGLSMLGVVVIGASFVMHRRAIGTD